MLNLTVNNYLLQIAVKLKNYSTNQHRAIGLFESRSVVRMRNREDNQINDLRRTSAGLLKSKRVKLVEKKYI